MKYNLKLLVTFICLFMVFNFIGLSAEPKEIFVDTITYTASSTHSDYPISNLYEEDDKFFFWSANSSKKGEWLQATLEEETKVVGLIIVVPVATNGLFTAGDFNVEVFIDNTWEKVAEAKLTEFDIIDGLVEVPVRLTPVKTKAVRLVFTRSPYHPHTLHHISRFGIYD